MNTTRISPFLLTFGLLVLLGAGCAQQPPDASDTTTPPAPPASDQNATDLDGDGVPEVQQTTSAHNSAIWSNGVDEAMVGTWTLKSYTVAGQPMNLFGHTMTINWDGTFTTDYSTETHPYGGSCEMSGGTSGTLFAEAVIDFDSCDFNVDPDCVPEVFNELQVAKSTSGGEVACEGPSGQTVATQVNNFTLGTGPVATGGHAPHVLYTYSMNDSWTELSISMSAGGPPITYNYVK